MNQKQYATLLAYWGMGADRSLEKLHQDYTKLLPKFGKVPSLDTLKNWSRHFDWQAKIKEKDDEVNQKLYQEAVEEARKTRVDIMKIFRAVVLRFVSQLTNNPAKEMTSGDIATFWKMARVEMGLPADHADITSLGEKIEGVKITIVNGSSNQSNQSIQEKLGNDQATRDQ